MRVVVEVRIEDEKVEGLTQVVVTAAEVASLLGTDSVVAEVQERGARVHCDYESLEEMLGALSEGTSAE